MNDVKVEPTKAQAEVIGYLRQGYRFRNVSGRLVKPYESSVKASAQVFHSMYHQRMIIPDPSAAPTDRYYILNDESAWREVG